MKHTVFSNKLLAIKNQEYSELKDAVKAHGGKYSWSASDLDNAPVISAKIDGVCSCYADVVVSQLFVENDCLYIKGIDRDCGQEVSFEWHNAFPGQLSFITNQIPQTKDIVDVTIEPETYNKQRVVAILGQSATQKAYSLDGTSQFDEFVRSKCTEDRIRTFQSKAEVDAYVCGVKDGLGWQHICVIDLNKQKIL